MGTTPHRMGTAPHRGCPLEMVNWTTITRDPKARMTTIDTTTQRPPIPPAEPSDDVLGAGRRALAAVAVDVLLALVPLLVVPLLALTRLAAGWAWTIALAAVAGAAGLLLAQVCRTGSSPGRRLFGVRTVSVDTQLPPSLSQLFSAGVLNADLRTGRDPLRLLPQSPTPLGRTPQSRTPRGRTQLAPSGRHGWQQAAPAGSSAGWLLMLDNGEQFGIEGPTLIGRAPGNEPGQQHALLAVPDLSRSISRVHALIEPDEGRLWLTDGGTTNGTRAGTPSASGGTLIERWLRPGERVEVGVGGVIRLGDRSLRVVRAPQPGA